MHTRALSSLSVIQNETDPARRRSAHLHQLSLLHIHQLSLGFAEDGHPITNRFPVLRGHHVVAHLFELLCRRGFDHLMARPNLYHSELDHVRVLGALDNKVGAAIVSELFRHEVILERAPRDGVPPLHVLLLYRAGRGAVKVGLGRLHEHVSVGQQLHQVIVNQGVAQRRVKDTGDHRRGDAFVGRLQHERGRVVDLLLLHHCQVAGLQQRAPCLLLVDGRLAAHGLEQALVQLVAVAQLGDDDAVLVQCRCHVRHQQLAEPPAEAKAEPVVLHLLFLQRTGHIPRVEHLVEAVVAVAAVAPLHLCAQLGDRLVARAG
mmetsp:Transcript_32727/g.72040  ORF Transcript_32727/g.72040 Transcript_32727/m.72040 type:complete len:318 (-) Transcript_32727:1162-2115(-)